VDGWQGQSEWLQGAGNAERERELVSQSNYSRLVISCKIGQCIAQSARSRERERERDTHVVHWEAALAIPSWIFCDLTITEARVSSLCDPSLRP
jgi:hypothetical protein